MVLVERSHKRIQTVSYGQHRGKAYDYRRHYHAAVHICRRPAAGAKKVLTGEVELVRVERLSQEVRG